MGTITLNCTIPNSDEIRSILNDLVMNLATDKYFEERGRWVQSFMLTKYGVSTPEDCKRIIESKRLAYCYDSEYNFYGIIANNRWLYTIDGRIVGKKGHNFDFTQLDNI